MIVVFTARARNDLDRIGTYIHQDNPRRAITFVREIVERSKKLADMPHRFSLVPGYEKAGIRRVPHGNYLIYYKVTDQRIEVLSVLHGAQDHDAILFPEDDEI
ncbi:type II toxin-antitoxin system RelE/ParE family toxin [Rhizobium sp. XQZ8]|uniref:type II toxin-antitoxin system RelE/ParE family toxin n=1 Tax=Rhizobium populisoli TaxID=2859785 RepID=UPI001C670CE3|nr:type II toxin-antitoxin system RelE/ParE family toxin [Rhizobium populisoli]MBW6421195.1 type II toxin-antitoxin system RelE/ParE family toxin [Rhizobium populisoli]